VTEMVLVESEVEVVARASRPGITVAYNRKIVREEDGGRIPGAVGRFCFGRVCTPPT
jgi:hypothetical protein